VGDGVESWMSRNNNILSLFSFECKCVFGLLEGSSFRNL